MTTPKARGFARCDLCGKLRPASAACCRPVLARPERTVRQAAVVWKDIPDAIEEIEAFLDMLDRRIETLNKRNDVPQSHLDGLRAVRCIEVERLVIARRTQDGTR